MEVAGEKAMEVVGEKAMEVAGYRPKRVGRDHKLIRWQLWTGKLVLLRE